ncbi:DUF3037 domain-containing protein [Paraflavitalea sp. CAU 1676]|uniref:DUF3037 domain-containing protein n=1 Tax=Paraflavitalea sp. CAU 1676 TaxID=3032598 RepID=UPI0023DCAFAA|nr:DUF3037 domain-containing protein [Paraflavitalea sp. CAU 1676]MDF2187323.1 DUF3037 domain-containing protein [Paraflavitalea sp. CAU 1676]
MQEQHLFEYAVIRVVPRVEREEFLNVGVVLYCKKPSFLQAKYTLDIERLRVFCPKLDVEEVKAYLCAFEHICLGLPAGGPIARLDMASRFRWLTATRSTVVQCSKVHPGFCIDPMATLEKLHADLVL